MNDPVLALRKIENILQAASKMDVAGQLSAYAATRFLVADLEAELENRLPDGSGYLHGKLVGLKWHIGAMFGLDIDNGHDQHAHLVWALGDLSVLKSNFERMIETGYPRSRKEPLRDEA